MKRTLAVIGLALVCASADALDIDPFKGPKPIAVLVETDPWLTVIGSDNPMVAIYDDGLVVYWGKQKDKSPVYLTKRLTAKGLADVKKKLSAFGDYSKLKGYYNLAPDVLDLPETYIYLSLGQGEFVTGVYGLMVSDTGLPTTFEGHRKPDELPKAVKDLHRYLTSLHFTGAKPWEPPYVEAMIWRYDYAPDESIHWPKDWPGLDSPNTLKRRDAYSIFFPGKELPKLRRFLKTQKEKGAVEIAGKKWAVSVRYTFPSEPIWRKAFEWEPEKKEEPNKAIERDKE